MRILIWNCGGAFRKKASALCRLRPDIAIIQECESPERLRAGGLDLDSQSVAWCGDLPYKGLAVLSFTGARLQVDPSYDASIKLLLPVVVNDAEREFRLIAVWTKETADGSAWYLGQASLGVQKYAAFLCSGESVVAGDFNSNQSWDRPGREFQHAELVAELGRMGLVSAYHHYHREAQGAESRYTHYWHKSLDHPFHIDFCFLPKAWIPHLRSVQIGDFDQWRNLSDHCPIIVDLEFGPRAGLFQRLESLVTPPSQRKQR